MSGIWIPWIKGGGRTVVVEVEAEAEGLLNAEAQGVGVHALGPVEHVGGEGVVEGG